MNKRVSMLYTDGWILKLHLVEEHILFPGIKMKSENKDQRFINIVGSFPFLETKLLCS